MDYFQGGKTIMVTEKTIAEMANLWKEEKRQFVKKSTYAAYSLIVETHILPAFGDLTTVRCARICPAKIAVRSISKNN